MGIEIRREENGIDQTIWAMKTESGKAYGSGCLGGYGPPSCLERMRVTHR